MSAFCIVRIFTAISILVLPVAVIADNFYPTQPFRVNLVTNGDANNGLTGWTQNPSMSSCRITNIGKNIFMGGSGGTPFGNYECQMTQTIYFSSVPYPSSKWIVEGKATMNVYASLGGYQAQSDDSTLTVTQMNSTGSPLGSSVVLGPVTPAMRNGNTEVLPLSNTNVPVYPGCSSIVVVFYSTHSTYWGCDGNGGDFVVTLHPLSFSRSSTSTMSLPHSQSRSVSILLSQSLSQSATSSPRYSFSISYGSVSRAWTTSSTLPLFLSPSITMTLNSTATVTELAISYSTDTSDSSSVSSSVSSTSNCTVTYLQVSTYSLEGTRSLSPSITASKGSLSPSSSIMLINRRSQLFASVSSKAATVDPNFAMVSIPIAMLIGSTVMVNFTILSEVASIFFSGEGGGRRTPITFDPQCSLHPTTVPYVSSASVKSVLIVTFGPLDGKFNVYGEIDDCVMSIGPDYRYIDQQQQGTLKIIVRCYPMTPTVSKSVATTIGSTTGVLALISMNPVAARTQSRVLMLTSLTVCAYAQDDQSYSFLGIGLSGSDDGHDELGYYYRGAVVGNIALFSGFVIVLKLVCALVAMLVSWKSLTPFTPLLDEVEGILHFPGAAMAPAALLLQPTLSAGVALLVVGSGPLDVSLGVLSVVFCLSMVLYFVATILVRCPTTLFVVKRVQQPQSSMMEDDENVLARLRRTMRKLFHGSVLKQYTRGGYHWESSDARGTLWKHKHLQMFSDTSLLWFVVVGMCGDVVVAVLNGVSSMGNDTMCLGQLVVMMILYVTQLVLHLLFVPSLSMLVHLSLVVTTFMSFACAVLVLIGVTTTSTSTQVVVLDANVCLAMLMSLVTSCQSFSLLVNGLTSVPVVISKIRDLAFIAGSGRGIEKDDLQSVLMGEDSPTSCGEEDATSSFGDSTGVDAMHASLEGAVTVDFTTKRGNDGDVAEASSEKALLRESEEDLSYFFLSQIDEQGVSTQDSRLEETSIVDAELSSLLFGGSGGVLDFLQIAEAARQDALTQMNVSN